MVNSQQLNLLDIRSLSEISKDLKRATQSKPVAAALTEIERQVCNIRKACLTNPEAQGFRQEFLHHW